MHNCVVISADPVCSLRDRVKIGNSLPAPEASPNDET
jgi:hypothetical protein